MSTYKVKSNLEHNNESYKPGDSIELNETTAATLVKDGVLEDVDGAPASDSTANPSAAAPDTTSNADPLALENLSYPELQERAKNLGLKFAGVSKRDLIENIKKAEAAGSDAGEGENTEGKKEGEDTDQPGNTGKEGEDENLGNDL